MTSERRQLENHPENGCIGCGPANPFGLQLEFTLDEGTGEVHSLLETAPRHEGWPGSTHSTIFYLGLVETANWTIYGHLDRVGVAAETSALELRRRVRTGEVVRFVGRLMEQDDESARTVMEARIGNEVVARMERSFTLPTREAFLERFGMDEVPRELAGAVPK